MSTSTNTLAVVVAFGGLTIPTVSNIPEMLYQARLEQKITSLAPSIGTAMPGLATLAANDDIFKSIESTRQTTEPEKIIGELRQWGLLKANWDGEGALAPSSKSIKDAVSFVRLMSEKAMLPEPALQVSGNASLFWNENNLYADIEFLGDNRIAYYIKTNENKHKGVISFDSKQMPAVFPAIFTV